jgi:GNAT superfamily N-acetyltransferase
MNVENFSVRVATSGDSLGVTALLLASYPTLMQPAYEAAILAPALEWMTNAQPALLASGTYYVAESGNGRIVGCGGWTKEHGDFVAQDGVGHIRHFGTHPESINRGIGKAIYSRCETDARYAGIARFDCQSSLNAEGFYSACGFKRIQRIDIEMSPGVFLPAIYMQCTFGARERQ